MVFLLVRRKNKTKRLSSTDIAAPSLLRDATCVLGWKESVVALRVSRFLQTGDNEECKLASSVGVSDRQTMPDRHEEERVNLSAEKQF